MNTVEKVDKMGLGNLLLNHQVGKYHRLSHTTSGGIPHLRDKDWLIFFLQPPLYFKSLITQY